MTRFDDKVVVITGASAGVGKAAAKRFHSLGARVVLVARTHRTLRETADELGRDRVLVVPMDVADTAACAALFRRIDFDFGRLDVLVNNAGFHRRGPVETVDVDALEAMVDVNLRAPIVLSRLAAPYIRKSGGGAIVNVASLAGCTPVSDAATYSATKFGLRAFSRAFGDEVEDAGIHVGAVSPGPIDTGFIMDELDEVTDLTLSQPMSTADEVAAAIVRVAAGERREIRMPAISGLLATASYLIPGLMRALKPLLEKRGRRERARYKRRREGSGDA